MKNAPRGKIQCLPSHIKKELEQRLSECFPHKEIIAWLNENSEVKSILNKRWGGVKIKPQNLSKYRKTMVLSDPKTVKSEAKEYINQLCNALFSNSEIHRLNLKIIHLEKRINGITRQMNHQKRQRRKSELLEISTYKIKNALTN